MLEVEQDKQDMVTAKTALPGRDTPLNVSGHHYVNGNWTKPPYPFGIEQAMFAMGCFWGAELLFWQQDGIYATAVGYAGGYTPNPTYDEVCTSQTGHAEVVLVGYDPSVISYARLLKSFWEFHDPTQGMRQGVDIGTQYRSAIYYFNNEQLQQAEASLARYQKALSKKGLGDITTVIEPAAEFYFAEEHHQQYLAKNPDGHCGVEGTGIKCIIDTA